MKKTRAHIFRCCILFFFALMLIFLSTWLLVLKTSNDFLRINYLGVAKDVGRLYALKAKNIDMCRNKLLSLYDTESNNSVLDRLFFPQSYDRKKFMKLLIEGFEEELINQKKIVSDTPTSVIQPAPTQDLE